MSSKAIIGQDQRLKRVDVGVLSKKIVAAVVEPPVVNTVPLETARNILRAAVADEYESVTTAAGAVQVATEDFLDKAEAQFIRGYVMGMFDVSDKLSASSFNYSTVEGVNITYVNLLSSDSSLKLRQLMRGYAQVVYNVWSEITAERSKSDSNLPAIPIPSCIPNYMLRADEVALKRVQLKSALNAPRVGTSTGKSATPQYEDDYDY